MSFPDNLVAKFTSETWQSSRELLFGICADYWVRTIYYMAGFLTTKMTLETKQGVIN